MKAFGEHAHLVDGRTGQCLEGAALRDRVGSLENELAALPAGLLFLPAPWHVETVCLYLAALRQGRAVALLAPDIGADELDELAARFRPALIRPPDDGGVVPSGYAARQHIWIRHAAAAAVHADLALVMSTSGSTGAARMVRLSRQALLANARSIVDALGITARDVAPTSMPFHLGYGLSVLHSHLLAGASIVVTDSPPVSAAFWEVVDAHRATSFAAVAHAYEMLARLRWTPSSHPSLRTLTQSGSRMRPELTAQFAQALQHSAGQPRFFLMYGQTEATARLAVLPPDRLLDKPGSVGLAVPGGRFTVRLDSGEETTLPQLSGEVVYRGANVMMGYADTADDLARGDELHGELRTGDTGHFDDEGFLYLDGRIKRLAKVLGVRINLDGAERVASDLGVPGQVAAVSPGDDALVIWCEGTHHGPQRRAWSHSIADALRLSRHAVAVRCSERLPLLPNGKIDYRALATAVAPEAAE